jgi:O-methyltransferase
MIEDKTMEVPKLNLYKPSLPVMLLKQVVAVVRWILPEPWYNRFYDIGFAFYRDLLHIFYLRFAIYAGVSRNHDKICKVRTVFKVMPFSLVGHRGLEATYDLAYAIERKKVAGSIVECGVAQGGSAALMALVAAQHGNSRPIWLFDSFEGLPEPTSEDFVDGKTGEHLRALPPGSCLGLQEQVEELLFEKLKLDRTMINLVKGWFENTLESHVDRIGEIALLRIDADWYQSVKCCLDNLYDHVSPGGYIVIDDYSSCFGAMKAVDEFVGDRNLQVELIHDGRGGCHFEKPT